MNFSCTQNGYGGYNQGKSYFNNTSTSTLSNIGSSNPSFVGMGNNFGESNNFGKVKTVQQVYEEALREKTGSKTGLPVKSFNQLLPDDRKVMCISGLKYYLDKKMCKEEVRIEDYLNKMKELGMLGGQGGQQQSTQPPDSWFTRNSAYQPTGGTLTTNKTGNVFGAQSSSGFFSSQAPSIFSKPTQTATTATPFSGNMSGGMSFPLSNNMNFISLKKEETNSLYNNGPSNPTNSFFNQWNHQPLYQHSMNNQMGPLLPSTPAEQEQFVNYLTQVRENPVAR